MINWIKSIQWDYKILTAVCFGSILVISLASLSARPSEEVTVPGTPPGIDTFIPRGFVLIPIEVQNYEALDSVLGKFGMVDLFRSKDEGGKILARNVRMLRAPQNPSQFAVLVAENQADQILQYQGALFVVVKPLSKDGTQIVNTPSRRRIVFEGE